MREIMFRGYNKKNGVWLYGSYILNRGHRFVCADEFATGKTWEDYEVDTESVGQFTGMCDKNGELIYEGDIVRDFGFDYPVIYRAESAGFVCDCGDGTFLVLREDMEVVGNVYNNHQENG